MKFLEIQEVLDYKFSDPSLLKAALTHPSVGIQRPSQYERLEFLGDRVLSLVVAEILFRAFPQDSEGDLSRRHTTLVRREALAQVAHELNLGAFLQVARGENSWGVTIISDACEAVIGALYLDGGLEVVTGFISRFWTPLILQSHATTRDPKSTLQEWAQGRGMERPHYIIRENKGPAHSPIFEVEVVLSPELKAIGTGSSKRQAEQIAAAALLETIHKL
jgi:ribonuclease-3